jgi:hypothetical protein
LLGVTDSAVRLANDQGEFALAFGDIANAKLILTDELIDAHLAAEAARAEQA